MYKYLTIFLFVLAFVGPARSQQSDEMSDVYLYQDTGEQTTIAQILASAKFTKSSSNLLNLGLGYKNYWIKTSIAEKVKDTRDFSVFIDQSRLFYVEVFYVKNGQVIFSQHNPFYNLIPNKKSIGNINYFKIPNNISTLRPDIYIHAVSKELFVGPVEVQKTSSSVSLLVNRDLIFGLYSGALLIMMLYNLFLYFSVQDRSYIFYVFYIFFTWLTQISVQGFASKYFWPENQWLHQHSVTILSLIALLFGLFFTITFLNIEKIARKFYKLLLTIFFLTCITLAVSFTAYLSIAFAFMQLLTFLSCIVALVIAYYVYFKKGFKPAGYYLLAWTTLIIGIMIFIAKDYGIVPYNKWSIYVLQIASIIEVTLLSFALADKINYFKKENELSQLQALEISKENERLIREQNVELEIKVQERTEELQATNSNLNQAIIDLKNAQSQLVDAEKMASLGQLTAGIAHEINNPINFVTSNIKPLELDINDLKEVITKYEKIDLNSDVVQQLKDIESFKKQIDLAFVNNEIVSLLSGIQEGAKRTAEIIRSLRNFSRVDETDMKPVDLNEGLESTLILIRNNLPDYLKVVRDYGNLPKVDCLPGKINQVFMNLISNGIQAIKSKPLHEEEEYLTVKTWYEDQEVKISIKDTGIGMTEETKHKIFEPFFTTKEIGEGTGLGLSIVFSIVEKHKGHIEVISKVNHGTEFIVTLPANTQ